ncbi:MAG: molecular chaperone TorD [Hyphomicrobiales bacterium]|nr:MAG: molecular chaperone TorD [Hyphomicrobiales bacterium]
MADRNIMPMPSSDRPLIYRWLSGLFARELDIEQIELYAAPDGRAFLDRLAMDDAFLPLVSAIRGILEDEQALHGRMLDLRAAYARLFLGAGGRRSAPPYHSAYASERGLLYQTEMRQMTDMLRELDLSVVDTLKEPPDHIAVQLSILSELAQRALEAQNQAPPPERTQASRRQIDFIDTHLLSWLPAFRDDCAAHDPSQFYSLAAAAVVTFLRRDRDDLATAEESEN